ncbi:MAG: twin transmembrane helix small protein [Gammaproteobacteria bacterium]|nr:twin transmembrane helix small protein [Gammaproteobacteria bacterium]
MLFKSVVLAVLAAILLALGSALFHMVRGRGTSEATVRALTWRIGLSVGLFVLLIIAVAMGWITPHGIQP